MRLDVSRYRSSSWISPPRSRAHQTSAAPNLGLCRALQVYNDFAQHLKGYNFDPTDYMPDLGLPSLQDKPSFQENLDSESRYTVIVIVIYLRGCTGLFEYHFLFSDISASELFIKHAELFIKLRCFL